MSLSIRCDTAIWMRQWRNIQVDDVTWQPTIESFDVRQALNLQENQDYEIFNYHDNTVLILIADRSKQNPLDINDQVNTTFFEDFVLFDLSSKTVKQEFPIHTSGWKRLSMEISTCN